MGFKLRYRLHVDGLRHTLYVDCILTQTIVFRHYSLWEISLISKGVVYMSQEGSCREAVGADSRESSLKEACLIV